MCFCIKNYIGPSVKICRLILPVAGASNRSKAVALVVFLFCVALCFYCQEFYVESNCSLFFSCLFSPV